MIYILHIDTSSAMGLVMLACDGEIVSVQLNETERDHATSINRMITAVLEETGIEPAQLHAVAVCSGPGSYTGLRIGMATAKGLCYALDKPLISHSKLALIVDEPMNSQITTIAILPARIGEYFIAGFKDNVAVMPPTHLDTQAVALTLNSLSEYIICGVLGEDLMSAYGQTIVHDDRILQAHWARLALDSYTQNKFANLALAEPLYLKQVFIQHK